MYECTSVWVCICIRHFVHITQVTTNFNYEETEVARCFVTCPTLHCKSVSSTPGIWGHFCLTPNYIKSSELTLSLPLIVLKRKGTDSSNTTVQYSFGGSSNHVCSGSRSWEQLGMCFIEMVHSWDKYQKRGWVSLSKDKTRPGRGLYWE